LDDKLIYLIMADAMLVIHVSFVFFVVIGLVLIFIGKLLTWAWVRNFRFRITHLTAIAIVVLQSWLGLVCPLTLWEMNLRENAGDVVYAGSFIAHWLEQLLYYRAPEWVFLVSYTLFGLLVIASWYWVRPNR